MLKLYKGMWPGNKDRLVKKFQKYSNAFREKEGEGKSRKVEKERAGRKDWVKAVLLLLEKEKEKD